MMRRITEYVDWSAFSAGGTDAHGNESEGWLDGVSVGVFAFDPGSSSEVREGMDRVFVEPTIYMPDTPVFGARDRVTARGKTYEVEGESRDWVHPTDSSRRANVVTLRKVEG